jgi:preprotein translocase subunit SecG
MSLDSIIVLCLAVFFFGGIFLLSYLSRKQVPPSQPMDNQNRLNAVPPSEKGAPPAASHSRSKQNKHDRKGSRDDHIRKAS